MTFRDAVLLDTLALNDGDGLEAFRAAVMAALAAGARPFEVLAGAPYERYGARLTFMPRRGAASQLAAALAIDDHPWGPPTLVSVRWTTGRLVVKAYHHMGRHAGRLPDGFAVPLNVGDDLELQHAALEGDWVEVYFRSTRERSWRSFVTSSLAPLYGQERAEAFAEAARPRPRPADRAHWVSYRCQRGALQAISVAAFERALPAERTVRAAWAQGLGSDDAARYERLVAAACTYGQIRGGSTNSYLAWSIDASGAEQRVAALAIPVRTG